MKMPSKFSLTIIANVIAVWRIDVRRIMKMNRIQKYNSIHKNDIIITAFSRVIHMLWITGIHISFLKLDLRCYDSVWSGQGDIQAVGPFEI